MKKNICAILLLVSGVFLQAQQISVSEVARTARFSKIIDEVNNGKQKIKYSDIQGIPYYYANFVPAKIGDTSSIIPIRYNTFLDTVEVLDRTDVYEIPREESYPKFTFETTKERLVLVKTGNEFEGYFFELATGKYRLLKKVITKFQDAIPAPNSLIPGTSARFDTEKPIYFIKSEDKFIRLTKKTDDLLNALPADKKDAVKDFIKTNKTKLNQENDLIKLVNFLNN